MRKKYVTPDLETVKFSLSDAILSSQAVESSIPENIGGDEEDDGLLDGF